MILSLAGSAGAGERLAPAAARRPGRTAPQPAPPRAPAGAATGQVALPRLARATHFLIHQLLAEAPDLGRAPPCPTLALAAYRAQLAERVRYFGPLAPVDFRV
jgi:hypothetical protein